MIAALAVLGVGGAALQADATFSTITARKLVIVGPDNDRRIELNIVENGAAALRVFSRNGVQVVDMGSRLGGGRDRHRQRRARQPDLDHALTPLLGPRPKPHTGTARSRRLPRRTRRRACGAGLAGRASGPERSGADLVRSIGSPSSALKAAFCRALWIWAIWAQNSVTAHVV